MERLSAELKRKKPDRHWFAASVLHACQSGWSPSRKPLPQLPYAFLHAAEWPGIDLSDADLHHADLSLANLEQADLSRTDVRKC